MKLKNIIKIGLLGVIAVVLTGCAAHATKIDPVPGASKDRVYEVTLTSLLHGSPLTPFIIASHNSKYSMFKLGEPASDALEHLAEAGDLSKMEAEMMASGNVHDIVKTSGLLLAGESVTVTIKTNLRMSFISLASMNQVSNDSFVAVNGTDTHHIRHSKVVYSPMYDAASEINSERCVHMVKSVVCSTGGEGYSVSKGEGNVHVAQSGRQIGDIDKKHFDYRNPVLKISIHRVK